MKKLALSAFISALSICAFANERESQLITPGINLEKVNMHLQNNAIANFMLFSAPCHTASGTVKCKDGSGGGFATECIEGADQVESHVNVWMKDICPNGVESVSYEVDCTE